MRLFFSSRVLMSFSGAQSSKAHGWVTMRGPGCSWSPADIFLGGPEVLSSQQYGGYSPLSRSLEAPNHEATLLGIGHCQSHTQWLQGLGLPALFRDKREGRAKDLGCLWKHSRHPREAMLGPLPQGQRRPRRMRRPDLKTLMAKDQSSPFHPLHFANSFWKNC